MYKKLKRTWSHGYMNQMEKFEEVFPELNGIDREEMAARFIELGMDFYTEEETPVKWWIRLTLPLAFILLVIMCILLPVNFIITGNWGYKFRFKNRILNWFLMLRIMI